MIEQLEQHLNETMIELLCLIEKFWTSCGLTLYSSIRLYTHVIVGENLHLCLIDIVKDMALIKASVTVATDLRVTV